MEVAMPEMQDVMRRGDLGSLICQVRDDSLRLVVMEGKGARMAHFLENEKAGRAGIKDLGESLQATQRQHAELHDGLQKRLDSVAVMQQANHQRSHPALTCWGGTNEISGS